MTHTTHGHCHTRLYLLWRTARQRYGTVPAWQSFAVFLVDMGERPDGATLARNDRTKPHGPGNSYWRGGLSERDRARLAAATGDSQDRLLRRLRGRYTLQVLADAVGVSRQRVHAIVVYHKAAARRRKGAGGEAGKKKPQRPNG